VKAVHFGAGNIGRGFVGLLLHEAGYEVVFADVAETLIDQLSAAPQYTVHEVGEGARDRVVNGYRALNSARQEQEVIDEVATADLVTTAVGPNILKFVAPVIAKGIAQRDAGLPALQVMACENAINATDLLRTEIEGAPEAAGQTGKAIYANTAVDRIVPNQEPGQGLDVTVETFFEWVIDRTPFGGREPRIPGATYVNDLQPYIERKLFTVNTGHASSAYFGYRAGLGKISEAMSDPGVAGKVAAVLQETKTLLVGKHGFAPDEQEAYVQKILRRFTNEHLPDTVVRVGRAPLRKLSRHERFVGPAAELAEQGIRPVALLGAMEAALAFDDAGDPEAVELARIVATSTPEAATGQITGLAPSHPLFTDIRNLIAARAGR
jgi:mannitol-1-phosphate 5-dehydrogenase